MKYLSLFSGIGGFELGIQQAYKSTWNKGGGEQPRQKREYDGGGEFHTQSPNEPICIGFSEIDKYAIQIYEKHFPEHKNYGDITKIKAEELPEFNFLVGGFPCQSFSIAGKRGGFNDTRGTLFFEIARILKTKQPNLLLLENVKGLLSHDEGRTFATIISTLDELGYDLQWQVLNSKNFGVPQNRERVFIVGHLRGTSRPEVFPIGKNNAEDIILPTITTRITADSNGTYVRERQTHQTTEPSGQDNEQERGESDNSDGRGGQTHTTNFRIRRLTPTECERLQGFPDGWTEGVSDTQRYKCLGNAVTVNVIKEIVSKILT